MNYRLTTWCSCTPEPEQCLDDHETERFNNHDDAVQRFRQVHQYDGNVVLQKMIAPGYWRIVQGPRQPDYA